MIAVIPTQQFYSCMKSMWLFSFYHGVSVYGSQAQSPAIYSLDETLKYLYALYKIKPPNTVMANL